MKHFVDGSDRDWCIGMLPDGSYGILRTLPGYRIIFEGLKYKVVPKT